jgi:hypothetical protein
MVSCNAFDQAVNYSPGYTFRVRTVIHFETRPWPLSGVVQTPKCDPVVEY